MRKSQIILLFASSIPARGRIWHRLTLTHHETLEKRNCDDLTEAWRGFQLFTKYGRCGAWVSLRCEVLVDESRGCAAEYARCSRNFKLTAKSWKTTPSLEIGKIDLQTCVCLIFILVYAEVSSWRLSRFIFGTVRKRLNMAQRWARYVRYLGRKTPLSPT